MSSSGGSSALVDAQAEVEILEDRLGEGTAGPELVRFSPEQHVRFSAPTLA
jgi:hypothetical protein